MLGNFLIIVGANLAFGSVGVAAYFAFIDCAVLTTDGMCNDGYFDALFALLGSGRGIIFWLVFIIGIALFWHGCVVRKKQ